MIFLTASSLRTLSLAVTSLKVNGHAVTAGKISYPLTTNMQTLCRLLLKSWTSVNTRAIEFAKVMKVCCKRRMRKAWDRNRNGVSPRRAPTPPMWNTHVIALLGDDGHASKLLTAKSTRSLTVCLSACSLVWLCLVLALILSVSCNNPRSYHNASFHCTINRR